VLVGFTLLGVAAWGMLWVLLNGAMSAQLPDPSITDGDPCCAHPDTWGQVAGWSAVTLALAALDAALFAAAFATLRFGLTGQVLRLRRLVLVPPLTAVVVAVVLGVALGVAKVRDDGVDCDGFAFSRRAWASDDADVRARTARGLAECDVLTGRTVAHVRRLLGPDGYRTRIGARVQLVYGELVLHVRNGRVLDATVPDANAS
jgi:hypothetical protein